MGYMKILALMFTITYIVAGLSPSLGIDFAPSANAAKFQNELSDTFEALNAMNEASNSFEATLAFTYFGMNVVSAIFRIVAFGPLICCDVISAVSFGYLTYIGGLWMILNYLGYLAFLVDMYNKTTSAQS